MANEQFIPQHETNPDLYDFWTKGQTIDWKSGLRNTVVSFGETWGTTSANGTVEVTINGKVFYLLSAASA